MSRRHCHIARMTSHARATALLPATLFLAACQTVPASEAPAGFAPISLDTMREATRVLSSDEFEGREPGTIGEERTLAYLVEQFSAAGLQPGNRDSWLQEVPLLQITADNVEQLRVFAGAQEMNFDFGEDWVGVSYREDERIDLEDSEIVFVGYGINAPEKGWNDYAGVDMRGKTALILVNDPDYEAQGLEGPFNGRAMTYYGRWSYKYEEAARQGAAAAIIVHDIFPASYGWNVVEGGWSGPQAHARQVDGGAGQTLVNGWVQKAVAAEIAAAAGHDFDILTLAAKQQGFTPVPLGVKAETGFDQSIRSLMSNNVIGILPGSSRPDEYVLHTAHWDHFGRCAANEAGDDICNGAIDNATGTAALIALAEAHAQAGPTERSQVFLAVTAEESGLLGSEYYGADPVYPLSRTVGGINIDALYVMGPARDVTVIGSGKSELDAYVERALEQAGRIRSPDPSPEGGRYYRSDHFSFAKRGVPMIYLKPGQDLIDGGTEAGSAYARNYTDNLYHEPDDEYDPDWDWRGVLQDLRLYFALGRMLGETRDWPNWYPEDEFRAVRDADCAGSGGC